MSLSTRKLMRLLVFFDLPVGSKAERRAACQFRHFLLKDGYVMLQWSVYARLANGFDIAQKHIRRLHRHVPKQGSVRCLTVTEKQYTEMLVLVGERSLQEKVATTEQILLF